MTRTRRSVLTVVGALLGAGCSTAPGTNTQPTATPATTGTTTSSTTTTTTTTPEPASVTVSNVTVTPGVVATNSPDSIAAYGDRGEQLVVAMVSAEGSPAPPSKSFALETDDATVAPATDVGGMGGKLWEYGQPYGKESAGWIAFTVAKPLETERATLIWPGGEHALSDAALARLARPPTTFEVRDLSAPDRIRAGEDATLEVTVANVGDADGTWVGALNRSGPSVAHIPETAISLELSAGETTTWTYTNTPDDRYGGSQAGTMTFRLQWRTGSRELSIEVTEES